MASGGGAYSAPPRGTVRCPSDRFSTRGTSRPSALVAALDVFVMPLELYARWPTLGCGTPTACQVATYTVTTRSGVLSAPLPLSAQEDP
eukprot:9497580-Pyramimonas_sp.AAC.1